MRSRNYRRVVGVSLVVVMAGIATLIYLNDEQRRHLETIEDETVSARREAMTNLENDLEKQE